MIIGSSIEVIKGKNLMEFDKCDLTGCGIGYGVIAVNESIYGYYLGSTGAME